MNVEIEHVIGRIRNSEVIKEPFYHFYIEDIFRDEYYKKIKEACYNPESVESRGQDSPEFLNNRYRIPTSRNEDLKSLYAIFESNKVKEELLKKFYVKPSFASEIGILKDEFEFVYTDKDKFQNIHTDLPSKMLSLVFYFPERELSEEEQYSNGTILYDNDLKAIKNAKFKDNSVCVFAQSLHSYHGFHTTTKRTALVLFYTHDWIHRFLYDSLKYVFQSKENRIKVFKSITKKKLEMFPLIEYQTLSIEDKLKECKINEEFGRVK